MVGEGGGGEGQGFIQLMQQLPQERLNIAVQGVAAAFLVRIPVAILMRRVLGTLFGIGLGVPVATACQILACFVFLRHLSKKKLLKQHTD